MNKSTRIAAIAGGTALVVTLVGYFAVLPMAQVSSYKKATEAKHIQLNDKMMRAYDTFKRPAFTNTDTRPASDKVDIQVAKDALNEARTNLDANRSALTKFSAWPLLSWNKQYKQVTAADAAEEKYVKQAGAFLDDYQVLLAYADKTVNLNVEAEALATDLESMDTQASPATMIATIDATVVKFQAVTDKQRALVPPAYLKTTQDKNIASVDKLIVSLKSLVEALRAMDIDKLTAVSADIDRQIADGDRQSQQFVTALQTESPIQHQIKDLKATDASVTASRAKL